MSTDDQILPQLSLPVLAVLASSMLMIGQSAAQTPANPIGQQERAARELLERQLRPDPRQLLERGRPVSEGDQPAARAGDGQTFLIRRIVTNESRVLPAERIRAIARSYEGRRLTIGEIQGIVSKFDDAYRAAGFKAGFAIVPNQSLAGGTLQITLVEPRVDGVSMSGIGHTDPDYIADRVFLRPGDLLQLEELERNLNLINRMGGGGLQVESVLQPGGEFGTTSVEIRVLEAPRFEVSGTGDSFGTRETGRARFTAAARVNSVTGRDDPLQFGVSRARDATNGFITYSAPILGATRLNLGAAASESAITAGEFAPLGLETDTQFASASLKTPLWNTERWLLTLEGGGEYDRSVTTTGPLEIERQISEAFARLEITYYGDTSGLLLNGKFGAFNAHIEDNAATSSEVYHAFSGAGFGYSRWGRFEARVRGNWQWALEDLLPSSKQFSLGGPYSVRGYQSGQFSGDSGFYLGAEARYRAAGIGTPTSFPRLDAFDIVAFADGGGVFPFRAGGGGPRREDFATSIGAGIEMVMFEGQLALFAGLAQPLDAVHEPIHNDNPEYLLSATVRIPF